MLMVHKPKPQFKLLNPRMPARDLMMLTLALKLLLLLDLEDGGDDVVQCEQY